MTNRQDDARFQTAPESITTVIDKGVHIEGTIKVDSGKSVLIHGEFTGKLESNGVVIISEGAVCTGSVSASKIRLAGTIRKGNDGDSSSVVAKEGLLVERTGRLETDELSYSGIELQYGAKISGAMVPMGGVDAPLVEEVQTSAAAPAPVVAAVPAASPAPAAPVSVQPAVVVPMHGVPSSLLASKLNLVGDQALDIKRDDVVGSDHFPQRANRGF